MTHHDQMIFADLMNAHNSDIARRYWFLAFGCSSRFIQVIMRALLNRLTDIMIISLAYFRRLTLRSNGHHTFHQALTSQWQFSFLSFLAIIDFQNGFATSINTVAMIRWAKLPGVTGEYLPCEALTGAWRNSFTSIGHISWRALR